MKQMKVEAVPGAKNVAIEKGSCEPVKCSLAGHEELVIVTNALVVYQNQTRLLLGACCHSLAHIGSHAD